MSGAAGWAVRLVVVGPLVAALALTAGQAGATVPPAAPVHSSTPSTAPYNPANDYMGSTIKAHEPAARARALVQPAVTPPSGPQGIDVSHWQGQVDWTSVAASGVQFAYMKATEGTGYVDPQFSTNYAGAAAAGLLRGAYHFAHPDSSSGVVQANYFVANGGGWSADGHTLPPVLDIEYNPSGDECYGMTADAMISWISDFLATMRNLTGRVPTIYTTAGWWSACTGNTGVFAGIAPLWVAGSDPTKLPAGWGGYTFWQYGQNSAQVDEDVFNGATSDLQAFGTSVGTDPLPAHYAALGGASSFLGSPSGTEYAVTGGWGQNYANGVILYRPASGAWSVTGGILGVYQRYGGPTGTLGYPTTDETGSTDGVGRYNHFQFGSVYWTPNTGAHEVGGAIQSEWAALGWERGLLGYPTTDETGSSDGVGRYNHFQNGSIFWSPSTGAHEVAGAIRNEWAAMGWERGALGYPTSDETGSTDGVGRYNHFQGGSIFWTPSLGAHEVGGAIRNDWASLGWETGTLGYPITDETGSSDGVGRYNHFQGGSIFWSPSTGAHEVAGAIRNEWAAMGWERGALGYPITDETGSADGVGRYNHFQGGSVFWSPSTGAHEVGGAIRNQWAALGWERGSLGYPTSDEFSISGGRQSNFQHGFISWNASTGAITVGHN